MKKMLCVFAITALVFVPLLLGMPGHALPEEAYLFERMWPTLQQVWYFDFPFDIPTDGGGNVYIADTNIHRIQKLTSTGEFITEWGSNGVGDGEF